MPRWGGGGVGGRCSHCTKECESRRCVPRKNVNLGRDFTADIVTYVTAAVEGSICAKCGGVMHIPRGIEDGNTFKVGLKYSKAMGATCFDVDGQKEPIVGASYGIGLGRLSCQGLQDFRWKFQGILIV